MRQPPVLILGVPLTLLMSAQSAAAGDSMLRRE